MSWTSINQALADGVETAARSVVGVRSAGRGPISGVVWNEDHVVTVGRVGRENTTAVRDPAGQLREARVVGRARRLGVALLEVSGAPLTPPTWSETLPRVGHLAVALGRVRGELHAAHGMISRVGGAWRTRWGGRVDQFIEMDGTLPSGGSGGALVGPGGVLMGMNTAGLIRGGTSLPPETLSRIIQRLLQGTGARRAYLGASFIPVKLPPGHVEGRSRALLTVGIEPGGPAELAGLSLGDVLLGLGSSTFDGLPALLAWLADHSPGDAVDAHLLRAGVPAGLSVTPTARED